MTRLNSYRTCILQPALSNPTFSVPVWVLSVLWTQNMVSKSPASSSAIGKPHVVPYTRILKLCNNTNTLHYHSLLRFLAQQTRVQKILWSSYNMVPKVPDLRACIMKPLFQRKKWGNYESKEVMFWVQQSVTQLTNYCSLNTVFLD
jgi:hypothetical protein